MEPVLITYGSIVNGMPLPLECSTLNPSAFYDKSQELIVYTFTGKKSTYRTAFRRIRTKLIKESSNAFIDGGIKGFIEDIVIQRKEQKAIIDLANVEVYEKEDDFKISLFITPEDISYRDTNYTKE